MNGKKRFTTNLTWRVFLFFTEKIYDNISKKTLGKNSTFTFDSNEDIESKNETPGI